LKRPIERSVPATQTTENEWSQLAYELATRPGEMGIDWAAARSASRKA